MSVRIDLKPEVQAKLIRQAAAEGVDLESYAASLLERAVEAKAGRPPLTHRELDATLRKLAQFSDMIPALPDEAFTRASLYQDHD